MNKWGKYIRHFKGGTTATNIKPVDELDKHQDFTGCKCNPTYVDIEDTVVHNAFDGRELPEEKDIEVFNITLDY